MKITVLADMGCEIEVDIMDERTYITLNDPEKGETYTSIDNNELTRLIDTCRFVLVTSGIIEGDK